MEQIEQKEQIDIIELSDTNDINEAINDIIEDSVDHLIDGSVEEINAERTLKVRLDKWLWAARFFKTRALAREAVENGRVYYNGERSKPSREIEIGAVLQIRQGRFEKSILVKGLSTRRRNTEDALALFEETFVNTVFNQDQNYQNFKVQSMNRPVEKRDRRNVRFLRRSFVREDNNRQENRNFEFIVE